MMSLQDKIRERVKDAMRQKDETRLSVLRGILASFTNANVAKKIKPDEPLSDDDALAVITREAKQRKDSIEQFEKGGRNDLAEKEKAELEIIKAYLPEQMEDGDIEKIVILKKKALGIFDKSGMGRLMSAVMKEAKGRVDGNKVKEIVERNL